MKTVLLVFWRIIRWIIYLVLILALPFVGTYGYVWFQNQNDNFIVHYDTEIVEKIFSYDLKQHVVLARGISDTAQRQIFVDGDKMISLSLDDYAGGYVNVQNGISNYKISDGTNDLFSTTNPTHFDATYLILGAILVYVIICIIAGLRRKRKNRYKKNKKAKSKKEKKQDEAIEDIIEDVDQEIIDVEDFELEEEYLEEQTLDDLIKRDDIEEYRYVDEIKETAKPIQPDIETKWCKALAEQGDRDAQYVLAVYYANGYKDIEKNNVLARFWLEKAASAGHIKAFNALKENE